MTYQRTLLPVVQEPDWHNADTCIENMQIAYDDASEADPFDDGNPILIDTVVDAGDLGVLIGLARWAVAHSLTAEQDGWVRVPVTLTDEMVSAWNDADPAPYPDGSDDVTVNRAWAQAEWSAMIAAVPPATVGAEQDGWRPIADWDRKETVAVGVWVYVSPGQYRWSAWTVEPREQLGCDGAWGDEPTHFANLPTPPANILDSTKEAGL